MFLEFSDWLIFADKDATRTYCAEEFESRCTCGYCRNFCATVDTAYPAVRHFLDKFGVNIEVPESLIPITPGTYQASYVAQGKVLRFGSEPIWLGDIAVTIEEDEEPDWFIIHLGLMSLPWVIPDDPYSIPAPYGLADMLADIKEKTPQ